MFRHKVMWSRGPHRPVARNKACSGVNNNHLDCRVAAHSFPVHTIQRWKLKLVSQVPQTEKLAFLFFLFFPFLWHKNHIPSPFLQRIIFDISYLMCTVTVCLDGVFASAFSKVISCSYSALYRGAFIKNCLFFPLSSWSFQSCSPPGFSSRPPPLLFVPAFSLVNLIFFPFPS